jgi:hypothetical protein
MKLLIKILCIAFGFIAFIISSCEEDIVSEIHITGRVYDADSGEALEGMAVQYKKYAIGDYLGSGSLLELLTYTNSVGYYETKLTIEKDRIYTLHFSDTSKTCTRFYGTIMRDVDKTKKLQTIDAPFSGSRCD